jgi:hypothetical protein
MTLRTWSDNGGVSGPTAAHEGKVGEVYGRVLNIGDEQGEVCLLIVEAVCPRQPASIENCRGNLL